MRGSRETNLRKVELRMRPSIDFGQIPDYFWKHCEFKISLLFAKTFVGAEFGWICKCFGRMYDRVSKLNNTANA